MVKRMFAIVCILFMSMSLFAEDTTVNVSAGKEEAGYALLESLVVAFGEMARTGRGGFEMVFEFLQKQMAELKKAKAQGQVDALFYKRYHRILEVLMLTIRMPEADPEGILDDFTLKEMKRFIVDVTGEGAEIPPPEHRGIGAIAGAIAEEILNLHIYLDGKKNREELLKKYMKWTKPPKK